MMQPPGPDAPAAERQLYALRMTYPGWEIEIDTEADHQGVIWWRATYLRPVTPEMTQRGIKQITRGSDGVELAGALSRQAALLPSCPPPLYR